jgi:hypothetical protein
MGRMLVFTNPVAGREAEFDDWYDTVHLPEVVALSPFTAAQRFRLAGAQIFPDQPHARLAIYEYEGDAAAAVEALLAAASSFRMSDAMASDQRVILVEELGARLQAPVRT